MREAAQTLSLMDELRRQAAAARTVDDAAVQRDADVASEIDRRLNVAFRWLDEAQGHLATIGPVVAHRFVVDPLLTIVGPRYRGGFASFRRRMGAGRELVSHVELTYRLSPDAPVRLDVPRGAAAAFGERLRAAHIEHRCEIARDASRGHLFTIVPVVLAAIRLVPDYRRQVVTVALINVDRLETVALEFPPAGIVEPALEDLMRLVLGETNAFLRRAPLAGVGPGAGTSSARTHAAAAFPIL